MLDYVDAACRGSRLHRDRQRSVRGAEWLDRLPRVRRRLRGCGRRSERRGSSRSDDRFRGSGGGSFGARRRESARGRRDRRPGGRQCRRRRGSARLRIGRADAALRGGNLRTRRREGRGERRGPRSDLRAQRNHRSVQRKSGLLRKSPRTNERLRSHVRDERDTLLRDCVRLYPIGTDLLRACDVHARQQERPRSAVRRNGLLRLVRGHVYRLSSSKRLHVHRHHSPLPS